MVAMLEFNAKGRANLQHGQALHNNVNMSRYQSARTRSGWFSYSGNAGKNDRASWNRRVYIMAASSAIYSYRSVSTTYLRTLSPYDSRPGMSGRRMPIAVGSNHFGHSNIHKSIGLEGYRTIKVNGSGRFMRAHDWGGAIGGNIKGRIATLKWRGDMLWRAK